MKRIKEFNAFIGNIDESLKQQVIDLYYRAYDEGSLFYEEDVEELEKLIPSNLLNNHRLNHDDMFKKMKDEDLKKVYNYLKSKT